MLVEHCGNGSRISPIDLGESSTEDSGEDDTDHAERLGPVDSSDDAIFAYDSDASLSRLRAHCRKVLAPNGW